LGQWQPAAVPVWDLEQPFSNPWAASAARLQHLVGICFDAALVSGQSRDLATSWQRITQSDSVSTGLDWGWGMKFVTGLLAAVLLLAGVGASQAAVRISQDRGGRIGTYVDKYQELRMSGEAVVIDGLCASACTIVLGAVAHDKICVTSHA